MPKLHQILDTKLKVSDNFYKSRVPSFITNNLNEKFTIRPYQEEAFSRFDFYWANNITQQNKPTHLLYHMATGSGKTLVMAGLIIYLYNKGYRNFLFFVNSSNIIEKTRDNFLNKRSSKYLFTNTIFLGDNQVTLKEVNNFQDENKNEINIIFSTIQGLHSRLNNPKENSVTFDDFEDKKLVLISDEAHHINAETKKGIGINTEEKEALISWERSVNTILHANSSNVLLEFTATADLLNLEIEKKYANKLIYNYPLHQFRQDGYSKEVNVLQTDSPIFSRALQAVLLSQYRKKIFENIGQIIKPIILFKSKTIKESEAFFNEFSISIQQLSAIQLQQLKQANKNNIIEATFNYFEVKNISLENLITEIQADFSEDKLVSVNSKDESEQKQLAVNSLEDENNKYRAIFAVDKLNEGWDVLNLFDIVRLYETNNIKQTKPDKTTVSEAQLIGRGARYCPFTLPNKPKHFVRQFDDKPNEEFRICEALFYHSSYNPKYISELHTALVNIGIVTDNAYEKQLKNTLVNKAATKLKKDNNSLTILTKKVFSVYLQTSFNQQHLAFEEFENKIHESSKKMYLLNDFGEPIIRKAIHQLPFYQFSSLKKKWPNLTSISSFITTYLNNIQVEINGAKTQTANLSATEKLAVCKDVLEQVGKIIYS